MMIFALANRYSGSLQPQPRDRSHYRPERSLRHKDQGHHLMNLPVAHGDSGAYIKNQGKATSNIMLISSARGMLTNLRMMVRLQQERQYKEIRQGSSWEY